MNTDNAGVSAQVDLLFRREAGKMAATLTRVLGSESLDMIEGVIQEALIEALHAWPHTGIPANPTAWLIQVARNRARDRYRRISRDQANRDTLQMLASLEDAGTPDDYARFCHEPGDVLVMMFVCCHPALSHAAQVAITLKTLGGFGTAEIARGLLARPETLTRRLSRARQTLREQRPRFELPKGPMLAKRVEIVLDVLYLMFNEGYSAHHGPDLLREDMCKEAIHLANLLERCSALLPRALEAKRQALLALMHLQASRFPARLDCDGHVVLLSEQDRALWDTHHIQEGLRCLAASAHGDALTDIHLQASIAIRHTLAPTWEDTDWVGILNDYNILYQRGHNPIVALNRAVAIAMVDGPAAGLEALDELQDDPSLRDYYLLPATRADLLWRVGEKAEAMVWYRKALEQVGTQPERLFLKKQLARCVP